MSRFNDFFFQSYLFFPHIFVRSRDFFSLFKDYYDCAILTFDNRNNIKQNKSGNKIRLCISKS